jgi:hypothetical protein
MKPPVEMAGGEWSNSSPPHHHPIAQLIPVDISFKDDVNVNFLLGISFMVLPTHTRTAAAPLAAAEE